MKTVEETSFSMAYPSTEKDTKWSVKRTSDFGFSLPQIREKRFSKWLFGLCLFFPIVSFLIFHLKICLVILLTQIGIIIAPYFLLTKIELWKMKWSIFIADKEKYAKNYSIGRKRSLCSLKIRNNGYSFIYSEYDRFK